MKNETKTETEYIMKVAGWIKSSAANLEQLQARADKLAQGLAGAEADQAAAAAALQQLTEAGAAAMSVQSMADYAVNAANADGRRRAIGRELEKVLQYIQIERECKAELGAALLKQNGPRQEVEWRERLAALPIELVDAGGSIENCRCTAGDYNKVLRVLGLRDRLPLSPFAEVHLAGAYRLQLDGPNTASVDVKSARGSLEFRGKGVSGWVSFGPSYGAGDRLLVQVHGIDDLERVSEEEETPKKVRGGRAAKKGKGA